MSPDTTGVRNQSHYLFSGRQSFRDLDRSHWPTTFYDTAPPSLLIRWVLWYHDYYPLKRYFANELERGWSRRCWSATFRLSKRRISPSHHNNATFKRALNILQQPES
ncbi:unnamed protein product [Cyclocybe aegerita]|uniref:Uncharacterized protein n=1 Tax=Cyclocybe aegerita TaxID=1973307 RepID=A0A8S0XTU1_CYCAE|nr:unnamed protein product [Cyclocybe aegerita]